MMEIEVGLPMASRNLYKEKRSYTISKNSDNVMIKL
jgi:hypothetical protein